MFLHPVCFSECVFSTKIFISVGDLSNGLDNTKQQNKKGAERKTGEKGEDGDMWKEPC